MILFLQKHTNKRVHKPNVMGIVYDLIGFYIYHNYDKFIGGFNMNPQIKLYYVVFVSES